MPPGAWPRCFTTPKILTGCPFQLAGSRSIMTGSYSLAPRAALFSSESGEYVRLKPYGPAAWHPPSARQPATMAAAKERRARGLLRQGAGMGLRVLAEPGAGVDSDRSQQELEGEQGEQGVGDLGRNVEELARGGAAGVARAGRGWGRFERDLLRVERHGSELVTPLGGEPVGATERGRRRAAAIRRLDEPERAVGSDDHRALAAEHPGRAGDARREPAPAPRRVEQVIDERDEARP